VRRFVKNYRLKFTKDFIYAKIPMDENNMEHILKLEPNYTLEKQYSVIGIHIEK